MAIAHRLTRLETALVENGGAGRRRCPACPPLRIVEDRGDGVLRDERGIVVAPLRCAACGGPHGETVQIVIRWPSGGNDKPEPPAIE